MRRVDVDPVAAAIATSLSLQAIGGLRHDRLVGFSGGCNLTTWCDAATCADDDDLHAQLALAHNALAES